jgi:hypothetical protein
VTSVDRSFDPTLDRGPAIFPLGHRLERRPHV